MAESKGIELAIELATRQRDEFAKAHAQAIRNVAFARDQMGNLESYARDTDAKWLGAANTAISAGILQHHFQFMERLQQAISMQTGVIDNLIVQQTAAHGALLQAEFRLAGLNKVLQTRQAAVQLRRQRAEQRHTDEFAALRHLHARAALMHGEHDDHRS
jgi:flagellar protein FliJ